MIENTNIYGTCDRYFICKVSCNLVRKNSLVEVLGIKLFVIDKSIYFIKLYNIDMSKIIIVRRPCLI